MAVGATEHCCWLGHKTCVMGGSAWKTRIWGQIIRGQIEVGQRGPVGQTG
jgi:hypothetical protein